MKTHIMKNPECLEKSGMSQDPLSLSLVPHKQLMVRLCDTRGAYNSNNHNNMTTYISTTGANNNYPQNIKLQDHILIGKDK